MTTSRLWSRLSAAAAVGVMGFTLSEGIAARLGHTAIAESPAAGWSTCALSIGATVASGVAAQPVVAAAATSSACQCFPIWIEEFEGMTCP
jgi:hypothetical protein